MYNVVVAWGLLHDAFALWAVELKITGCQSCNPLHRRRRTKRSGFGSRLSAEMAQFLGVDSMSRTEARPCPAVPHRSKTLDCPRHDATA